LEAALWIDFGIVAMPLEVKAGSLTDEIIVMLYSIRAAQTLNLAPPANLVTPPAPPARQAECRGEAENRNHQDNALHSDVLTANDKREERLQIFLTPNVTLVPGSITTLKPSPNITSSMKVF